MLQLIESYHQWLVAHGFTEEIADFIRIGSLVVGIFTVCLITHLIARQIIVSFIANLVKRSKNQWDDIIMERKVFNRMAHFAPALVLYLTTNALLSEFPKWIIFTHKIIYIYMTVVTIMVLTSFMKALHEIYQQSDISKNRPIKGYIQLVNIFIIFIGVIFIVSFLTGSSPGNLLAGLGALAAVLLLVFKDTILGLTASVQLSANNMLKIGDYIEMPSNKADGTVVEITLNTVKVQNADNTIVTIPTYSLVSNSFSNWREMVDFGGRRIKRSIFIDLNTVKFISQETAAEYIKSINSVPFISNPYENNHQDIKQLTNLGLFRMYVENYLRRNPRINQNLTLVVRYLQPAENGIPLEVYAFSTEVRLAKFEEVQSELFEYIISMMSFFELRVFQNPSGYNIEKMGLKL
jgi:miniconductance mechanosensitive channel